LHELTWDSHVKATAIGVELHRGVVTLTGTVDTFAEKVAAEKAAHRVMGVKDVANDILVKAAGVGAPTDTEIALAVREALKWNAFVPEHHITSTVADGWVTLQGGVPLWSQRFDAEKAVRVLRGVRGVSNRIDVVPEQVEPASIRRQIEQALERHADREAGRIKIDVEEGTLKLSGMVRGWDELKAVRGAVSHAPGIRRVEEDLQVDPYA
jgi:osmotically-inducible protein OsmY